MFISKDKYNAIQQSDTITELKTMLSHFVDVGHSQPHQKAVKITINRLDIEDLFYSFLSYDDDANCYSFINYRNGYVGINVNECNSERYKINLDDNTSSWSGNSRSYENVVIPAIFSRAFNDLNWSDVRVEVLNSVLSPTESTESDYYVDVTDLVNHTLLWSENENANKVEILEMNSADSAQNKRDFNQDLEFNTISFSDITSQLPQLVMANLAVFLQAMLCIVSPAYSSFFYFTWLTRKVQRDELLPLDLLIDPDDHDETLYNEYYGENIMGIGAVLASCAQAWAQTLVKRGVMTDDERPLILRYDDEVSLLDIITAATSMVKYYCGCYPSQYKLWFNALVGSDDSGMATAHDPNANADSEGVSQILPCDTVLTEQLGINYSKDTLLYESAVLPNGTKTVKRDTEFIIRANAQNSERSSQVELVSSDGIKTIPVDDDVLTALASTLPVNNDVTLHYLHPLADSEGDVNTRYTLFPASTVAHLENVSFSGVFKNTSNYYTDICKKLSWKTTSNFNDIYVSGSDWEEYAVSGYVNTIKKSSDQVLLAVDAPTIDSITIRDATNYWSDYDGHVDEFKLGSRVRFHPAILLKMMNRKAMTHTISAVCYKLQYAGNVSERYILIHAKFTLPRTISYSQVTTEDTRTYKTIDRWVIGYGWITRTYTLSCHNATQTDNNCYFTRLGDVYTHYTLNRTDFNTQPDEKYYLLKVDASTSDSQVANWVRSIGSYWSNIKAHTTDVTRDLSDYIGTITHTSTNWTLTIDDSDVNIGQIINAKSLAVGHCCADAMVLTTRGTSGIVGLLSPENLITNGDFYTVTVACSEANYITNPSSLTDCSYRLVTPRIDTVQTNSAAGEHPSVTRTLIAASQCEQEPKSFPYSTGYTSGFSSANSHYTRIAATSESDADQFVSCPIQQVFGPSPDDYEDLSLAEETSAVCGYHYIIKGQLVGKTTPVVHDSETTLALSIKRKAELVDYSEDDHLYKQQSFRTPSATLGDPYQFRVHCSTTPRGLGLNFYLSNAELNEDLHHRTANNLVDNLYWFAIDCVEHESLGILPEGAWEDRLDNDTPNYLRLIQKVVLVDDNPIIDEGLSIIDQIKRAKIAKLILAPHFDESYLDDSVMHLRQLRNYQTPFLTTRIFNTSGQVITGPDDYLVENPHAILIKNTTSWSNVYLYAYRRDDNNNTLQLRAWPGIQLETTTINGEEWYVFNVHDFYGQWDYVVLNDGAGHQTNDINLGDPNNYVTEPVSRVGARYFIGSKPSINTSIFSYHDDMKNQRYQAVLNQLKRFGIMGDILDSVINDDNADAITPSLYQIKAMTDTQNASIIEPVLSTLMKLTEAGEHCLDSVSSKIQDAFNAVLSLRQVFDDYHIRVVDLMSLEDADELDTFFHTGQFYHHAQRINPIHNGAITDPDFAYFEFTEDKEQTDDSRTPLRKRIKRNLRDHMGQVTLWTRSKLQAIITRVRRYNSDSTLEGEAKYAEQISIINDINELLFEPLEDEEGTTASTYRLSALLASLGANMRSLHLSAEEEVKLYATLKAIVLDHSEVTSATIFSNLSGIKLLYDKYLARLGSYLSGGYFKEAIFDKLFQLGHDNSNDYETFVDVILPQIDDVAINDLIANYDQSYSIPCELITADAKTTYIPGGDEEIHVYHLPYNVLQQVRNLATGTLAEYLDIFYSPSSILPSLAMNSEENPLYDAFAQYGKYSASYGEADDNDLVATGIDDTLYAPLLNIFFTSNSTIIDYCSELLSKISVARNDQPSLNRMEVFSFNQQFIFNDLCAKFSNIGDTAVQLLPISKVFALFLLAVDKYNGIRDRLKEVSCVALTGFFCGEIENIMNDQEAVLTSVFTELNEGEEDTNSLAQSLTSVLTGLKESIVNQLAHFSATFNNDSHIADIISTVKSNIMTYVTNVSSAIANGSVLNGLSACMSNFTDTINAMKASLTQSMMSVLQRVPILSQVFNHRGFSIYDEDKLAFDGYQSLDGIYAAMGVAGMAALGVLGLPLIALNNVVTETYRRVRDFIMATVYDGQSITYRRSGFEAVDISCYKATVAWEDFVRKYPQLSRKMAAYHHSYPGEFTASVVYAHMFVFFTVSSDMTSVQINLTPKLYDTSIGNNPNDYIIFEMIYNAYDQSIQFLNDINAVAMRLIPENMASVSEFLINRTLSPTLVDTLMDTLHFNVVLSSKSVQDIYDEATTAPYIKGSGESDSWIAWGLAAAGAGTLVMMTGNVALGAVISGIGVGIAGIAYLKDQYEANMVETNSVVDILNTARTDKVYGDAMITNTEMYELIKGYPIVASQIILNHLELLDDEGLIHSGDVDVTTDRGLFISLGFVKGEPRLALHLRSDIEMYLIKALRYGIIGSTALGGVVLGFLVTKPARLKNKMIDLNTKAWTLDSKSPKYASQQRGVQKRLYKTDNKIQKMCNVTSSTESKVITNITNAQTNLLDQFSVPLLLSNMFEKMGYGDAAAIIAASDRTKLEQTQVSDILDSVEGDGETSLKSKLNGVTTAIAGASLLGLLIGMLVETGMTEEDAKKVICSSLLGGSPSF